MKSPALMRFALPLTVALLFATAPLIAEERLERDLRLDPGGRLELETDGGTVSVTGGSGSGARVVITTRREATLDSYDIKFEESASGLVITARRKPGKRSSWNGFNGHLNFEIEVPNRTDIDIHTSGGGIKVASITGGVQANTSGGSIDVRDVDGDVDVDTSGGGINIDGVRGDVEAETSGGSTDIRGVTGKVDVESSGGSIEVTFAPGANAGGRLSTSGGGVRVWLDRGTNVEIDAATSGGSVKCDLPITVEGKMSRSSLRGTIGAGGPRLLLRSAGGSIRIAELEG